MKRNEVNGYVLPTIWYLCVPENGGFAAKDGQGKWWHTTGFGGTLIFRPTQTLGEWPKNWT
jgi:hypothetical protein